MVDHIIEIDPNAPLASEPHTGHNRWHEMIEPVLEVDIGDVVTYETRAASDAQVKASSSLDDIPNLDRNRIHPLTGPVFIRGASPGDLLSIEIMKVDPDPWEHRAYTICSPNIGFLHGEFNEPFLVHWNLDKTEEGTEYAESPQIPRLRIPASPFPGIIGVAPSSVLRRQILQRENGLSTPEPREAIPSGKPFANEGLRTIPARENGGNIDTKQATAGASVLLPVFVEGALVSVGDVHFAQGDGEVCGTAVEMAARVHVKFSVRRGEAQHRSVQSAQIEYGCCSCRRTHGLSSRYYATTGISSTDRGSQRTGVSTAARSAIRDMISYLVNRGFNQIQAYVICSVAVDLRISQLVNSPSVGVTAVLPLDVLQ